MKENTSKTAAEWLLHFPPSIRERVREERKKYKSDEHGGWGISYITLSRMLLCCMPDTQWEQRGDPYWNDVYNRIEAGEFDKPWVEPTPEPVAFEVGDEVELFWVRGRVHEEYGNWFGVTWADGAKNSFDKGSLLHKALHKVTPKEPTVYERFPIGSRWTVELEVEVKKHDTEDSRNPIQFRGLRNTFYMWFPAGQLHHFKPLKD